MFFQFDVRFYVRACSVGGILTLTAVANSQQEREDSHHSLDEITVLASPLARTVEKLAQPTTVLSGSDLALNQAASIGETVSQQLGVSSTYFGPVSSRPVIRGQFGERVRVLANGLDSLDASALSEDHQVSVDSILADRVEIVRGPATLLYGSGAAGGLVNVVDSRIAEGPLEKPFAGAVAFSGDSAVGERAVAARFEFGSQGVAVHVDYFGRRTDDVSIPGFAESGQQRQLEEEKGLEHTGGEASGVLENTDSRTSGGAGGITLTGDAGFLGVSVSAFNSDYGVPGHGHNEEQGSDASARIDLEQIRFDARGEYNFDAFVDKVSFRFANNDYRHIELEGVEVGTVFDTVGTDARLELHHARRNRLEGAFGLQYKRIDFDSIGDEAFVPKSDTVRSSLFLFEEYGLDERRAIQASARVEQQTIDVGVLAEEYSDTAFGVSLGMVWTLSNRITASANIVRTERHPNSTELYADGPHIAANRIERGSITQNDGVLKKEVSTNLDLTVRGESDRLEWAITAFVNNADEYVLLRPTATIEDGLQVFEYKQADVEILGYEAEARVELFNSPVGHWHTRIFSDFVYAEEESSGAYLPRIPPLRLGIGLHYSLGNSDAGIELIAYGEQTKTAVNELPTDSYTLLNINYAITIGDGGSMIFFRGSNLTDRDARQHTSPLKEIAPLPGRSFHAGIRYWF